MCSSCPIPTPNPHPGGADALVLVRGRDCTALFESYHAFTDKPRQVLPKFLVTPAPPVPPELGVAGAADGFFVPAGAGAAGGKTAGLIRDPFWVSTQQGLICSVIHLQHLISFVVPY